MTRRKEYDGCCGIDLICNRSEGMQAGGQLSREVQNSFRLVYCSLKDHGRQSLQGASPIEDFYEKLWRCVQPGRLYERLAKPRVEAFYSNNMSAEGFCSLLEKNVLTQNFEESGVVDICLDTFVLLDPLEQEIDRYLTRAALKQLWMVFAKLDTFRCQGVCCTLSLLILALPRPSVCY